MFGEKIRELRIARKKRLREVAADLDIDQAIASKIETGSIIPNNDTIEKFSKYYNCSVDKLKIIAYSDKIISKYGNYKHFNSVIEKVKNIMGRKE